MKIKLYRFNGFLQSEKEILNLHLYDLEDDGEVLKLFQISLWSSGAVFSSLFELNV